MKRKNKKKGVTLVFLLAMAMIITIIGGVLIGSISYTRNSNNNVKINQDLIYAAESGIDQAIANVEKSTPPNFDVDGDGIEDGLDSEWKFNLNIKFSLKNIEVDVELDPLLSGNGYKAVSTAKSIITGNEKVVKANITKTYSITPGGNNLLMYSICAKETNIYHQFDSSTDDSAFFPELSKINGDSMPNIKYIGFGTGKTFDYSPDQYNNDGFLLPDLKHNRASGNIEVNTISELDLLAEETRRYPTTSMTGVKKEIINLPSVPGNKITIYYININQNNSLIIENPNLSIDNTVIICSGNVVVYGEKDDFNPSGGLNSDGTFSGVLDFGGVTSLSLRSSTIIANKVNLYVSSLQLANPSYEDKDPGLTLSPINKDEINDVVNSIAGSCNNWAPGVGIPGPPIWGIGDVVYD